MKIKFTYVDSEDELLKEVGIGREEFWQYMSPDDWAYALVFDRHILQDKIPYPMRELLRSYGLGKFQYIALSNKTVGMAYFS